MRSTAGRLAWAGAIVVASGIAGALAYSYLASRLPPIPPRPLRIGFEPNPPFQVRTDGGFSGIAIDIVTEAAKRAGVTLEWVETGTSSDEAFQKGLVDLWPLMVERPDRRKRVYLSRPWVLASHVLIARAGLTVPGRSFSGRIAIIKIPVHARFAREEFPSAQVTQFPDAREAVVSVCRGTAAAGLLEKQVAMMALHDMPPECASTPLRTHAVSDLTVKGCVASTFAAAGAADRLRGEIGNMFRDGTLGVTMAKYSFYGLDEAWETYDLMQAAERSRWIAWGTAGLAAVLLVALGQALSLRQRKRAERVLRESEERFRAIFHQAGVGVAQVSMGGNVELANDRYCEVVGHRREDLLGKGTREITLSEDLKEQLAMMPRLLSGEIQSFSTEKRYERKDGRIVWAEMCKSLVREVDGKPKCFIAVVEDITERKQAEAALKESEERFRNMADSAPVLIWVAGLDKLCTFFNKGWLEFTGRTLEQERGNGWAQGVHPEDLEGCIATSTVAFDKRQDFHMEYRLRRADGEYRCVINHGVARFAADGAFAGYIGSAVDITDLKRNYERHLATQKLESLGVLAAGVAHDFNNLLGAIVARAESAESELAPDSPATDDVDQIRVTALRAAEIVSQLMTFAGQENAPLTAIDLSSLVTEILDLLRLSVAKTAVLKTELAAQLPLLHANAAEIRQVVMNLIINASEALEGKPGCITITTAPALLEYESAGVRLVVQDTGCGMTDDVKARIFDPFFTMRFMGRGLGLSAVQGIVRRQGGSIEIESAPGKGSRFTVLLACEPGQGASAPRPEDSGLPAVKPGGGVLLIEDEYSLRSVVAKALRKRSFQVLEAADGATAIELLKSNPDGFGVVVLDVTLPGIWGAELLDELRAIRPEIKVILSTAYSRETAMQQFGGRAIWGFIRKPFRTDDLVKLLQGAMDGSGGS
jgi:two-component system cell cycle sensor histidine kinase/response regulator CckA